MSQTLLDIQNLSISFYGEQGPWAVNDISFSLNKAETIGIVGESGSGKSVTSLALLNLLSGVKAIKGNANFTPEESAVNLIGIDIQTIQGIRGKQIAMIFQEPMTSLNPVITCGEQVAEAVMLHNKINEEEAKRQTISLFEKVELPRPAKLYESYPHQISGGQKQRVMIAMALAGNPKLLIADEPTTALDVTVQKGVLLLLKKLQAEYGMGIIFISHDLGIVKEVSDKIAVMYRGNLVEQGKTEDIFNKPQHPYTKALIACRPPLNSKPTRLSVISDFMIDPLFVQTSQTKPVEHIIVEQTTILELKNLDVRYPAKRNLFGTATEWVHAVNNVSLSITKGQTIGLVGESGCGKSTIGKTIVKLVKPSLGAVLFNGKDIDSLSGKDLQEYRSKVQLIFQDPYASLNPRLTVGEAIMEALEIHAKKLSRADRKKRALYLLDKVGLTENQLNKYPHEFSGGQRQRICIARTLAVEPALIVCDESVAALDVSVQAQVLNLLNDLKQEFGLTYIFISHDLAVIKYMSDYMYVMNKGKIEEQGLPDDIYEKPQSAYTKALIEAIPEL